MDALILVSIAAAAAVYTDSTRGRIPNALVAALLIAGFALRGIDGGIWAIGSSVLVCAAVLAAGLAGFSAGIIGGGDVKFIAAAAAALGWPSALSFVLYTLVAGGLLALAVSLARGTLRRTLANVGLMAMPLLAGGKPALAPAACSGKMPYAYAILGGAIAAVLANHFAFSLRIPL